MKRLWIVTGVVAVAGLATVIGAVAAPAASDAASASTVKVVMKEFTLVPKQKSARAGKVTFVVKNAGKLVHEFVVVKTNKAPGNLLQGDEANEDGAVGEIGDIPPGTTKKVTLKLKKGKYVLLCNLPGHYKAGQFSGFRVS